MALFDLLSLRNTVRQLASQVKGIGTDLEKLRRQRDELLAAPAARSDIKAALAAQVAANAARFNLLLCKSITPMVHKPELLSAPDRVAGVFGLLSAMAPGGVPSAKATDLLLCGVAGDRVTSALCAAVDAMEWPAAEGLPQAQRAAEVEKLDKRIAELQAEEAHLVREARAAGIVIEVD